MKILIATGIYPPEIGGPAEYASNLARVWKKRGNEVSVKIFGKFQKYPWGIRHVIFFFYIIPSVAKSDYIVTLDAFSAGVVTLASKIFNKKIVFRTGGDVLWELYTERTGDMVLLRDFYIKKQKEFSLKEKIIFSLMRWTLQNLSAIIWSTEWQKNIFIKPYGLDKQKNLIVENYFGKKLPSGSYSKKNFIGGTRKLKWKNIELVKRVFETEQVKNSGSVLDLETVPHNEFLEKIRNSYAVIIASLGDISPNTIIDAITCGTPFIVTKESGLFERIKDVAIFVDPKDPKDIEEKVLWLSNENNYKSQKQKIESWNFVHDWDEIATEYEDIYKSIK